MPIPTDQLLLFIASQLAIANRERLSSSEREEVLKQMALLKELVASNAY